MNGFAKQAFFYRQRAEQLRQRAQALGSNKAKQQLLDLANGYDWMAGGRASQGTSLRRALAWGTIGCEMDGHKARALKYRLKAEELRSMLPDMKDEQSRKTLERIAIDYDHLAMLQEMLARSVFPLDEV